MIIYFMQLNKFKEMKDQLIIMKYKQFKILKIIKILLIIMKIKIIIFNKFTKKLFK